jgi:hypothetical protein
MKKSKVNIEELPLYSDPSLIVAGDKAKFHYDKAKKDWCVVDILNVEDAHGGHYISWSMEHDTSKAFRTYVRPGNVALEEPTIIVGTTIPLKMVKNLAVPRENKRGKVKKEVDI